MVKMPEMYQIGHRDVSETRPKRTWMQFALGFCSAGGAN